jgi:hypothetical protein
LTIASEISPPSSMAAATSPMSLSEKTKDPPAEAALTTVPITHTPAATSARCLKRACFARQPLTQKPAVIRTITETARVPSFESPPIAPPTSPPRNPSSSTPRASRSTALQSILIPDPPRPDFASSTRPGQRSAGRDS